MSPEEEGYKISKHNSEAFTPRHRHWKPPKISKNKWNYKRVATILIYIGLFVVTCFIMVKYFYVEPDWVCHPGVGCFMISEPWSERPSYLNFVPKSPNEINTTLILTTRDDPIGKQGTFILPHKTVDRLKPWKKAYSIVFIIHGYTDDSTTWMQDLKRSFLKLEDTIVILVDWRSGASGHYPQVVANTRVVAREINIFINHIFRQTEDNLLPKQVHLIGHSLGSHIAGYVGKELKISKKFLQITALDPAFPLFEDYPPEIRLDRSDAQNVLVIHSNIGPFGLGMKKPAGSVDIYLNNGRDQRECPRMTGIWKEPLISEKQVLSLDKIASIKDLVACSHRRAYEVLQDVLISLGNLPGRKNFVAYPMTILDSEDPMENLVHYSFCKRKGKKKCWNLDHYDENLLSPLPNTSVLQPTFFLPTTNKSPFCVRLAFLEANIGPSIEPLLLFHEAITNYSVSISYDAFGENVLVFEGKLSELSNIQAWVEFPCGTLTCGERKIICLTVTFRIFVKVYKLLNLNDKTSSSSSIFSWSNSSLRYYDTKRNKIILERLSPQSHTIPIMEDSCMYLTTLDASEAKLST